MIKRCVMCGAFMEFQRNGIVVEKWICPVCKREVVQLKTEEKKDNDEFI